MKRSVITKSGRKGWQDKLQNVYSSFEEFESYCENYGVCKRLGYSSPEEAWEENPTIQGSTNPSDLRVVKESSQGKNMKVIKEVDGLTSIVDTEVNSQKAVATGEKSPEIPALDTSKSPIVDIYATGKAFEISDNSKIYQCVKIVKDIIDRQFFNQQKTTLSFQFSINVKNHQVAFDINVANNQLEDNGLEQMEKLADILTDRINRYFDGSVDVAREIKPLLTGDDTSMDNYGRTQMRITVTEKIKGE